MAPVLYQVPEGNFDIINEHTLTLAQHIHISCQCNYLFVNLNVTVWREISILDIVYVNGHLCTDRNIVTRSILRIYLYLYIIKIQLHCLSKILTIILHLIIPLFKIPVNLYIHPHPEKVSQNSENLYYILG
jgi:hypothetical protein